MVVLILFDTHITLKTLMIEQNWFKKHIFCY